jgi:poly(beta-D-mannuronate) lyase
MPALSFQRAGRCPAPDERHVTNHRRCTITLSCQHGTGVAASFDVSAAVRVARRVRLFAFLPLLAYLAAFPARASDTTCDDPPAPVRDIIADRFYVDSASSVADTAIIARNKTALATLDNSLIAILAMADKGLTGDKDSATCAGRWLAAWAKGDAMLGHMSSQQAAIERKWRTAGLAVGYLKIRGLVAPAERAAIDAWMDDLADHVVADQGWPAKRNNQVYWAGFAAGAVGTATGTARHLEYARRAYDAGMTDIRPDGTLRMELARRQKALDYHNYALAPLVMTAELAALRGEDWYVHDDGAIHRLAARVLSALRDPKGFAALAGETSVEVPRGGLLGWLAFYRLRFPDRVAGAPGGPFHYPWLGGDLTLTAKAWVKG